METTTATERMLADVALVQRHFAQVRKHVIAAKKVLNRLGDDYGLDDSDEEGCLGLLDRALAQSWYDMEMITSMIETYAELDEEVE